MDAAPADSSMDEEVGTEFRFTGHKLVAVYKRKVRELHILSADACAN